jgi:hypothetical protein
MPRTLGFASVLVAVLSVLACTKPTSSPEVLVEAAFESIKKNDWKAYAPLTITTADFMLQENKVSKFKQGQTYAGGMVRPEEHKQQEEQFRRAAAGGAGILDFRQSKFDRAVRVASADQELLSGSTIPVTFYAVALNGAAGKPSQLDPGFVVVEWNKSYRLLGLRFRDAAQAEQN